MTLLWPSLLYLLLLIPLLLAAYIVAQRRRRIYALRYSSLALVQPALKKQSRWRRYLPVALFLLALGVLIFGLSRPTAIVAVPTNQTTIILAIDVSGSMRSADIPPTRIQAAETAALDFIHRQKPGTQIGIVAFSGNAEEVQAPTTDTEALAAAINRLYLGRATAIGSGILRSIDAIAEIDPAIAKSLTDPSSGGEPPSVVKGAYAPDIVVLLTDGVSNAGPDPVEAAQQAVTRGIRVYTIGFGTLNGFIQDPGFGGGPGGQFPNGNSGPGGQFNNGGGGFNNGGRGGGGGFGGRGFRTPIDEATLKQIADMTGGEYYKAESADQLQKVFQELPTYLIMKHETEELTVGFTLAGALLAFAAMALSLLWSPMP